MGVAPSEVHRNDSERELRHRAPLPALKGDTLWLDRRSPIIGLALHTGLIRMLHWGRTVFWSASVVNLLTRRPPDLKIRFRII